MSQRLDKNRNTSGRVTGSCSGQSSPLWGPRLTGSPPMRVELINFFLHFEMKMGVTD